MKTRFCDLARRRSQEDRYNVIACEQDRRIADDHRSVFPYDRCDFHTITCQSRTAIETYPIIFDFRPMIQRVLPTKLSNKEYSLLATAYLLLTWVALNKVTLVTRNLWRKLRDMSALTTVTVKFSKKNRKKKTARNLFYRPRRGMSNSAT